MTFQTILKPKLSVSAFALICSLYLAVANNTSFFAAAFAAVDKSDQENIVFKAALFICLVLLFYLIILLLGSIKAIFKPLMITIMILAAVISYFMSNYGVIIDVAMIQNVMETDFHEALELMTPKLFGYLAILGILPAISIYRVEIQYQAFIPELINRIRTIVIAALLLAGTIYFNYKDFSFVLRNNHSLRYLINPNYPVYSLVKYLKGSMNTQVVVRALGTDAKQSKTWQERGKKSLVILVVGETARAENFSLNGYDRATNPNLSREDIIYFSNTHSCGTATAVSLPCMFSNLKQSGFSDAEAKQNENLLDVLKHAGIHVVWLDNNSGCKGVCQRATTVKNTETLKVPGLCADGECYDEILLQELKTALTNLPDNSVIVLHQKGSHGPAYYKRHPKQFTAFTPECTRNEVQDCSQIEIENAYNNTILYTDFFLAELIKLLKTETADYQTAMIYMSDHGESLGENGIYLHGLPYAFAPEQQIHIPFVVWLSKGYSDSYGFNAECLKQHSQNAYSHDNLFHSVLGLLAVKTDAYEGSYDIFAQCQTKRLATAGEATNNAAAK